MLKIRIDYQSVDIDPGTSFALIDETPIMSEDNAFTTAYTTTIELPMSPRNKRILRHNLESYACEISHFEQVIMSGIFFLDEKDYASDRIKGSFVGSTPDAAIKRQLSTLSLGSTGQLGTTASKDDTQYLEGYHNLPLPHDDYLWEFYNPLDAYIKKWKDDLNGKMVFAPIRLKSVKYEDILWNDGALRTMFINPYFPTRESYYKPSAMGAFLPGIRIGLLLDTMFNGRLRNNFFQSGDYRKLVLQTTYHPTLEEGAVGFPYFTAYKAGSRYARGYEGKAFVPKMTGGDILRELMKLFCFTIFYDGDAYRIVLNKELMLDNSVVDISPYYLRTLSEKIEKGKFYKYGYSDYEKEEVSSLATQDNFYDLFPTSLDDRDIIRCITSTGQTVSRFKTSEWTYIWEYEILSSGYGGNSVPEDNELEVHDMTSNICPLSNSIHNIWGSTDPPDEYMGDDRDRMIYDELYIPELSGLGDDSSYPKIMIMHGYSESIKPRRNYPFMSGKNVDVYGNKLTSITLDWDGPEGLYENYHKEFAEWVSMDKTVKRVESRFPMTILKNLQMYKRVLLNGKVFRIRRSETPIYNNEYGKTTLELVQDDVLFENM